MADTDEKKGKVGGVIFCLALIAVGIWAILQPDLLNDFDPHGRRSLLKSILKWAWGTTGGIVTAIIGVLAAMGILKGSDSDEA